MSRQRGREARGNRRGAAWADKGRRAVCALTAAALLASAAGDAAARGACGRPEDLFALRGINLPQLSFGDQVIPGRLGTDYHIPSSRSVAYFTGKGMNLIRIAFIWERLQPVLNGPLNPAYLAYVMAATADANRHGAAVLLDVHNGGRYRHQPLGSAKVPVGALADLWSRLAPKFADRHVFFGLMNEPHDQSAADWRRAADAAVAAIRKTGATNPIYVMGADWGNPVTWMERNATLMLGMGDPNLVYEFHQYLDFNGGGTKPVCVNAAQSVSRLTDATEWLRRTGAHGFIGEIGIGANPQCNASLTAVLGFLQQNRDVWLGWAYWAGGQGWGDYFQSVEPRNDHGARRDAPQMAVLQPFLPCPDDASAGGDARPPYAAGGSSQRGR